MIMKSNGVAKLRAKFNPLVANNRIAMKLNRSANAGSNFTKKDEIKIAEIHDVLITSKENLDGREFIFSVAIVIGLISILRGDKGQRRACQDVEIKSERPMFNVIEIAFHAPFNLFFRIRFASPTVYLCPTGETWFDTVSGEIATHYIFIKRASRLGLCGMGARTHQRKFTLHHIKKLWQFINRSAADEAADFRNARITFGDQL